MLVLQEQLQARIEILFSGVRGLGRHCASRCRCADLFWHHILHGSVYARLRVASEARLTAKGFCCGIGYVGDVYAAYRHTKGNRRNRGFISASSARALLNGMVQLARVSWPELLVGGLLSASPLLSHVLDGRLRGSLDTGICDEDTTLGIAL